MISIVVPVYNVGNYIIKCIDSIVNQDYKDFELILVNDGSTDDTVEKINSFLCDKKINWKLLNKENGGQSSAKNFGYKKAKGDYIIFMDSDDVVSSDFLSKLLDELVNYNAEFSFGNFKFVKKQIPPIDTNDGIRVFNREELLNAFLKRSINFVVPSMLFRRSFLEENNILFNEDIRFSEDQIFIWDAIFNSRKSVYVEKIMYGYFLREKSIMTSSPYNRIIKAHEVFEKFSKKLEKQYPKDIEITKLILPRWELGTLYSAAKLIDINEFNSMCSIMSSKTILNRLISINEIKAYLLASVFKASNKLAYSLCRKMA